jgi:aspartyl protease family protein
MDLKDRYYWTKYREIMGVDNPFPAPVKKRSKYKIAVLILIIYLSCVVFLFLETSDFSLEKVKNRLLNNSESVIIEHIAQKPLEFNGYFKKPAKQPTTSQTPKDNHQPIPQAPRGVSIQADVNGHYRGMILINNVSMPFLIDTGATHTVIPTRLSYAARLPQGQAYQTSTANGMTVQHLTRINSFKIGNLELRNLEAATNDHLDEVLIGMNTLKLFRMTQDKSVLTLVAYPEELVKNENAAASIPVPQGKTTWTKTVECDGNKSCRTSYR